MSVTAAASTPASATSVASAVSSAAATNGLTSADFLNLLVSELQNQDPLAPTSTTDVINQMSQYANFDQQQELNGNLSSLLTSFNSMLTLNAINYLGHTIEAKGSTTPLQGGAATFGYSLTSAASQVQLTIQDTSGNIVWSGTGPAAAGMNTFTWNGVTSSGAQLPDGGQYTLTVTATDASGRSVYGFTTVSGKATGIDDSSGTPMLTINGVPTSISSIVGVTS